MRAQPSTADAGPTGPDYARFCAAVQALQAATPTARAGRRAEGASARLSGLAALLGGAGAEGGDDTWRSGRCEGGGQAAPDRRMTTPFTLPFEPS